MRLLLIGSGAREHAIARAIVDSADDHDLVVAPGNAGTAPYNIDLDTSDHAAVVAYCRDTDVDMVVVGPEVPLVAGLIDDLRDAGIAGFGPDRAAAQLEGSKSFARDFAARHSIPGPQTATFTAVDAALDWLADFGQPVVVKADGLAAGKGVIIPASETETESAIRDMIEGHSLGDAGQSVVLEERLSGEELSLIGFCDGTTVKALPFAQDHKRVGIGDTGPNTGGMGAFAPVPGIDQKLADELVATFLQRAVDGMASDGTPYKGLLYAGIMLTDHGPRLIEYNCRLGDPEAQVLLELLDSDLVEVMQACIAGELADTDVVSTGESAAVVVVAAAGYPGTATTGIVLPEMAADAPPGSATVLYAGVTTDHHRGLVSSGGRVLSVVGTGTDLGAALESAYGTVDRYLAASDDLFARPDIGWRHHVRPQAPIGGASAYAQAGVSLTAGAATTSRIAESVKSTHDDRVVAGLGSFGGVFDVAGFANLDQPLLVATTDGVGTKTVLAEQLDRWEGCGADIVNHGINDVLVQGAIPLFFLDTVASEKLDPEIVGRVVDGMAAACRENNCVLLGGETAEMPGVLTPGSVDIAGTLVGVVERSKLLPRAGIGPGHMLVAMSSSGLHTNGYSLARRVVADMDLESPLPGGDGQSIGDALVAVHRSYLAPLAKVLELDLVAGLAHITGGGLTDNLPRILPKECGAKIDVQSWPLPPLFRFLVEQAELTTADALNILNCGVGMVLVVAPADVLAVQDAIDEPTWIIGEVTSGSSVLYEGVLDGSAA